MTSELLGAVAAFVFMGILLLYFVALLRERGVETTDEPPEFTSTAPRSSLLLAMTDGDALAEDSPDESDTSHRTETDDDRSEPEQTRGDPAWELER